MYDTRIYGAALVAYVFAIGQRRACRVPEAVRSSLTSLGKCSELTARVFRYSRATFFATVASFGRE